MKCEGFQRPSFFVRKFYSPYNEKNFIIRR